MKINTFSIVIGTKACNAKCPFCISRMTGFDEVKHLPVVSESDELPNFESAVLFAKQANVSTVLLTGKGEPTLYPAEITSILQALKPHGFPFTELQTNALSIGRAICKRNSGELNTFSDRQLLYYFEDWHKLRLNTIAISVCSIHDKHNKEIYSQDYPDLRQTIKGLHDFGFTVRLGLMLIDGMVDRPEKLEEVLVWCKENKVEQLTIRPIRKSESTSDEMVSDFVATRGLSPEKEEAIKNWVMKNGTPILSLSHGAVIYDLFGQNICLTDCLTVPVDHDHIRTLIYYRSGLLTYDWQFKGAILLGGRT